MTNTFKWDVKEIEEFFKTHIEPKVEPGTFPSYKFLLKNGYLGFYIALFYGKTKKYPNVQSFCDEHNLKRVTEKKWTREFLDRFYQSKILPHVQDDLLPPTSWFKKRGWEYWGFIGVLNAWSIQGYKNVKDFREKNGLRTSRIKKTSKEDIDSFYVDKILPHIRNNTLPTFKWFQEGEKDNLKWYRDIMSWKNGYRDMSHFCKVHGLEKWKKKSIWTKESIDEMFEKEIRPLMDGNKFLSYAVINELGGRKKEWYNVLRNNRVKWYKWIKDFKKKNKLK